MDLVRLLLIATLISLFQVIQGKEPSNNHHSISLKKKNGSLSRQATSAFLTASGSCFEPLRYSAYRTGYTFKSRYTIVAYSRADAGKITYVLFACDSCVKSGRIGSLLNDAGVTLSIVKSRCSFAGNRAGSSTRPIYDCATTSLDRIVTPNLSTCTTPATDDFLTTSSSCFEPLRYSAYRIAGYTYKSRYTIVAYSRVDTGKLTYVLFTCNSCTSSERVGNLLNAAGVNLPLVMLRCTFAGNRAGSSIRPIYDCTTSSLDIIVAPSLPTCSTPATNDFLSSKGSCSEPLRYSAYKIEGYTYKSRYTMVAYSRVDVGKLTYVLFTCNRCTSSARAGNFLNAAGVTLSLVKTHCVLAGYRAGAKSRPIYDCATSSLDSVITSKLATCPSRQLYLNAPV